MFFTRNSHIGAQHIVLFIEAGQMTASD